MGEGGAMPGLEVHPSTYQPTPPFRLDVPLHELLTKPTSRPLFKPPTMSGPTQTLPEPVFPQHPKALLEEDGDFAPPDPSSPYRRRWSLPLVMRGLRGWCFPYVLSRALPGDFHPIISYLFTEWKCNHDCHYCWAFDNRVRGMTEDVAKRCIDWLHSSGCRVLALMGGEPLLRPDFAHKVIYYGAKKGFWVYLPTNGRLMRHEVIDRIGDTGVAVVNLAVDCVDEKPGLPKALTPIRSYFEYLIKKQYRYGFAVFFNMNITRINMDDVKQLTQISHDHGIATDYHINESPMIEQSHFQHMDDNDTFIRPQDFPKVDALVDWLIDKNRQGYKMVNSVQRLQDMKAFMRGKVEPWKCRAGQNSMIVRVDGTLAPCFPMYSANYDWGTIENHKFEVPQLNKMKKSCQTHCFSTLNHNLAYCYNDTRVLKWVVKQAVRGFQGATGSFG
jgi:MoaA/NifB/PqqE/SkfB family radical SAM enzyme